MSDERAEFSKRLAEAMRDKGHEPRPSVLFRNFNSRYEGDSVAFQTASRWLRGEAMPEQDKLVVLADWLGVDPHRLRFGPPKRVRGEGRLKEDPASYESRALAESIRGLSPEHRKLVRELVAALSASKANR
jgi:transcriptional regulator with XRE-family HTH domain